MEILLGSQLPAVLPIMEILVGPFFFQEQTININTYLDMLQLDAVPQLSTYSHTSFYNKI
jgi:hypothetical protein